MNKLRTWRGKTTAFLVTTAGTALPVMADVTTELTTESAAFKTQFLAGAALIGIAYIGAAYGAVIYKWLKAMVFGG